MTFGGFKETSESMENNEAKTENTEKKRNQILEIPDEYKDDFDKKIETSENKEQQTDTEKKDTPEGGEKTGWFEKIKGFFSKEKETSQRTFPTSFIAFHFLLFFSGSILFLFPNYN